MNNGYVAIIDSGIGGFSVLAEAAKTALADERFLYFGDNRNAPYGNKSKGELYALLRKNLDSVLKYDVKAVVVACNTLSLSVLPLIAPTCRTPIFGVYPPVLDAVGRGRTFLFATPVTCSYFKARKGLSVFPLRNLAADIEKNKSDLSAVNLKSHIGGIVSDGFPDTLILGCTHYFFVKKQFADHFCPRKILSGEALTVKKLSKYLSENGLKGKSKDFSIDFTGDNSEENFNFYNSVVKEIIFGK